MLHSAVCRQADRVYLERVSTNHLARGNGKSPIRAERGSDRAGDLHGLKGNHFHIVESAQKEDLASFEEALLPHLDAAHNLARWLLRNEQDAQDVVQEAYLRAFKSFSGFHGSNGRAWLLTIVRNTSYTLLKKNHAVDLTTVFDEEIHASGHESVSPATILEYNEDAELIREAMDKLPAEFREILALRHQEGLSYKEIADVAQIPPGTVMSRLARARAKLKEYLADRIGIDNK
jgi:RNA polymerase sigma-70 factor (ECF subfamily)